MPINQHLVVKRMESAGRTPPEPLFHRDAVIFLLRGILFFALAGAGIVLCAFLVSLD